MMDHAEPRVSISSRSFLVVVLGLGLDLGDCRDRCVISIMIHKHIFVSISSKRWLSDGRMESVS